MEDLDVPVARSAFGGARRRAFFVVALFLMPVLMTAEVRAENTQEALVRINAGLIRGERERGVYAFKGVRYGADTVPVRFRPSTPPLPWSGIADATSFASACPQTKSTPVALLRSWAPVSLQSEDCLFLNVWTPGLGGQRRPVMVWLHGGGYTAGAATSFGVDGQRLARRGDVVVVSVNHRLNAFGYLYLAGLSRDPHYEASGSVGTLDTVQALHWVHDNIARFGGDPGNVTIFGQSGGAAKVATLMAFPPAAGLFHKAIMQSGSMSLQGLDPAQANDIAERLFADAGLKSGDVDKLIALPYERIVELQETSRDRLRYRPVTDGVIMPRDPFTPDAPEISASVPLLIGSNRTETTYTIGAFDPSAFTLSWKDLPAKLAPFLARDDIAGVIADQRRLHPTDTPSDVFFRVTTWQQYRKTAIAVAERKAQQRVAPVYMYQLTWKTPVDGGKWQTPHLLDLAFVFDNVAASKSIAGVGNDQQRLADLMSDAWIAFARTGRPGASGLPTWPAYNLQTRSTMMFNAKPEVINDPESEDRQAFAEMAAGRTQ